MIGPYRPNTGDTIKIDEKIYRFTPHPHAKNMPYGQSGRKATVYQIELDGSPNTFFALKVFLQAHRSPRYAETQDRLRRYAALPGLQVCDNRVLTPEKDSALLANQPDLKYSVKMIWVNGKPWEEFVQYTQPITQSQSRQLGLCFLHILKSMEEKQVAHCDISGPNVLVNIDPVSVSMVDVEDLYAADLKRPDKPPGGSDGYAHLIAPEGLWSPVADRFAGAILLSEMLGWCDDEVRRIRYGQSYFDPKEVQKNGGDRLRILCAAMDSLYGSDVSALLKRAWNSSRLEDCPSFQEWTQVLLSEKSQTASSAATTVVIKAGPVNSSSDIPVPFDARTNLSQLRSQAYREAGFGHWAEVLQLYDQITQKYPEEKDILPLQAKAIRLIDLEKELEKGWSEAIVSGKSEAWQNCLKIVQTLLYLAPTVIRYKEQREQAQEELNQSLLADQASQLMREKRWNDALALLKDLPIDHPSVAPMRAQVDLELERIEKVKECLENGQLEAARLNWKEAINLYRRAIALGADPGQLQPLLDKAYSEQETERNYQSELSQADELAGMEKWNDAIIHLEFALKIRPERVEILNRIQDFKQYITWAERVEKAQESLAAFNWLSAIEQLENIPPDFMNVKDLRDKAQKAIAWEGNLAAARKNYRPAEVISLLDKAPISNDRFDETRQWAQKELARSKMLEVAQSTFDFQQIPSLLENAPAEFPNRAFYVDWMKAEQKRSQDIQAAFASYDVVEMRNLYRDLPDNHPEKPDVIHWLDIEEDRAIRINQACAAYAPEIVSKLLADVTDCYPNYSNLKTWIQQEHETQTALANAKARYDLTEVQSILQKLPKSHPLYSSTNSWFETESERKEHIEQGIKLYEPEEVAYTIRDLKEGYPNLASLQDWVEQWKLIRSRIHKALEGYQSAALQAIVKDLPVDYPEKDSLTAWLATENDRNQKLVEAQSRFDYRAVRELLSSAPENYPSQPWIDWSNTEEKRQKKITESQNEYRTNEVQELLAELPPNHPMTASLAQWFEKERALSQQIQEMKSRYDLAGLRTIISSMPEDHPALMPLEAWITEEESRTESIRIAQRSFNFQKVSMLIAGLPASYPDLSVLTQWVSLESERAGNLQNAIQTYSLERVQELYSEFPPGYPQAQRVEQWIKQELNWRERIKVAQNSFDLKALSSIIDELPADYPELNELRIWLDQNKSLVKEIEANIQNKDLSSLEAILATVPTAHPSLPTWKEWAAGEHNRLEEITQLSTKIEQFISAKEWDKALLGIKQLKELDANPGQKILEYQKKAQQEISKQNDAATANRDAKTCFEKKDYARALGLAQYSCSLFPDNSAYQETLNKMRMDIVALAQAAEASKKWKEALNFWSLLSRKKD